MIPDASHIHRATPADLPDLITMIHALSAFQKDTATITLDQLRDAAFGTRPTFEILIAKRDGVAIGYAGLIRTFVIHSAQTRMDIHHLFVKPDSQRTGVACALIAAARDHAHTLGATRLTIGTDPDSATSVATYRAMGNLKEITGLGPRFWVGLDD